MARHRLPPLKSLVYFEAAARLQSFTRASRELNMTQGPLVRPTKLALRTDARFYLILPVGRTPHENTLLFRDWLLANR